MHTIGCLSFCVLGLLHTSVWVYQTHLEGGESLLNAEWMRGQLAIHGTCRWLNWIHSSSHTWNLLFNYYFFSSATVLKWDLNASGTVMVVMVRVAWMWKWMQVAIHHKQNEDGHIALHFSSAIKESSCVSLLKVPLLPQGHVMIIGMRHFFIVHYGLGWCLFSCATGNRRLYKCEGGETAGVLYLKLLLREWGERMGDRGEQVSSKDSRDGASYSLWACERRC